MVRNVLTLLDGLLCYVFLSGPTVRLIVGGHLHGASLDAARMVYQPLTWFCGVSPGFAAVMDAYWAWWS